MTQIILNPYVYGKTRAKLSFLKEHATKQFTQTSEIGAYVAFLSSDAAKNITGTTLPIDGGWTAK